MNVASRSATIRCSSGGVAAGLPSEGSGGRCGNFSVLSMYCDLEKVGYQTHPLRHYSLKYLSNFRTGQNIAAGSGPWLRQARPAPPPCARSRADTSRATSEGPIDRNQRDHHPKRHRRSHTAKPKGQQTDCALAVDTDKKRGKRRHGQKKRRSHACKLSAPAAPAAAGRESNGPFLPKRPGQMRKVLLGPATPA